MFDKGEWTELEAAAGSTGAGVPSQRPGVSWLSFSGRIGRRRFWLGHIVPGTLIGMALILGEAALSGSSEPGPMAYAGVALWNWALLVGYVKRMHDHDYSVLVSVGLPVALWASGFGWLFLTSVLGLPDSWAALGVVPICGAVAVQWLFAFKALVRLGTVGSNRFGPSTLGWEPPQVEPDA